MTGRGQARRPALVCYPPSDRFTAGPSGVLGYIAHVRRERLHEKRGQRRTEDHERHHLREHEQRRHHRIDRLGVANHRPVDRVERDDGQQVARDSFPCSRMAVKTSDSSRRTRI